MFDPWSKCHPPPSTNAANPVGESHASAAKATGRMCRAWLALGRHLQMGDECEGAAARRREARERSPNLRAAMLIAAVAAAALRPAEVSGTPAVGHFEVAFVDRATGPSAFPLPVRPSRVGTFAGQTKSGAGYFYDEVLEYRVWLHPERGAEPLAGTYDYFAAFARYETAAEYARTHAGSEDPIVLVLQREHINEPSPGVFEHVKRSRITEWKVEWLAGARRGPRSIPDFLRAHRGK